MSERIHIRGGHLIDPATGHDGLHDLFLADGRVLAIGSPPAGFTPDTCIEADGLLVLPGLIELAAHLGAGDPAEALRRESRAALAGGVTTLCLPPGPLAPLETTADAELVHLRGAQQGDVRLVTLGAITRGPDRAQLAEMATLADAGCRGVSDGGVPLRSTRLLRRAMDYAAGLGLTLHLSPQDPWLREGSCAHEGEIAARLGLPGDPATTEVVGLARLLALVELTGARVHLTRLSAGAGLGLLRAARERGLPVTADVAIHHLHLTEAALADFDNDCHVQPPLRTPADRDALQGALGTGLIDSLCADHHPCSADAKRLPFPQSAPGIAGVQTLLSLSLMCASPALSRARLVAALTAAPAALLNLSAGRLAPGDVADLCLVDPAAEWQPASEWHSGGQNSPFRERRLRGRVVRTLLAARTVYRVTP